MKLIRLFLAVMLLAPCALFSQGITIGGQFGWAVPQGKAFERATGEKGTKGGLAFDFDVLYHFDNVLDGKLAAGLTYNTSILFGVSNSDGLDISLYGLSLYGVKGLYKFIDNDIYPYAALSVGLSQLSTPEYSDGAGNVLVASKTAFSFGLRPEIGVNFGGFNISAGYLLPMPYDISGINRAAGALQISIGWKHLID